jgi:hypothetical protein
MSNATVSSPWLIVWSLGVFGHLLVGFCKNPLPLLWALDFLIVGFYFILGLNFK